MKYIPAEEAGVPVKVDFEDNCSTVVLQVDGWNIVKIDEDGYLHRCTGIPPRCGLKLNAKGQILTRFSNGKEEE